MCRMQEVKDTLDKEAVYRCMATCYETFQVFRYYQKDIGEIFIVFYFPLQQDPGRLKLRLKTFLLSLSLVIDTCRFAWFHLVSEL